MNKIAIRPLVLFEVLVLGFALSACSDSADNVDDSLEAINSNFEPSIFITFEVGPNKGRHQYIVGDSPESKVELKYSKPNDATFLELSGLVSLDGRLKIDELRRFTKGQLIEGNNLASTWRAESSDQTKQCGVLNLRDPENTQIYQNGFGMFTQCGDTAIDSLSLWSNVDDSVTKNRITKGRFSDRVKFEMSMDNAPFRRFESDVAVEFVLLETAARF